MDAARADADPPPELRLAWWCGDSRLPDAGGVLDQDAETWGRMQALRGVYNLVTKISGLVGDQIHRLTDSERRTWRWLIDEEIW